MSTTALAKPEFDAASEIPVPDQPVVFYDAKCGLCDRAVQQILNHDKEGKLKLAPLGGETAQALLPEELAGVGGAPGTMVLYEPASNGFGAETHTKSSAALNTMRHIGGFFGVLSYGRFVPQYLRDLVYEVIAKNRYKFFGKVETCRIPTQEERERFLP